MSRDERRRMTDEEIEVLERAASLSEVPYALSGLIYKARGDLLETREELATEKAKSAYLGAEVQRAKRAFVEALKRFDVAAVVGEAGGGEHG